MRASCVLDSAAELAAAAFSSIPAAALVTSMSDFDHLYAKYAAMVFRYALKCVGRRDVAEDITSEVFLTLHRHLHAVEAERLPGWLFTIAKNKAVDYWRRAEVERRYLDTLPASESSWSPSVEFWLGETKALKPVHRAVLILRYVHGMDRAAIGSHLGLSEIQVKGLLQYALTILRREFEKVPS